MKTFKVLALLLHYPEADWLEALPEMRTALREERRTNRAALERLRPLFAFLRDTPLIDAQVHYVETFDRQPRHALYLYEHLFGESRARGNALADLLRHYREHELVLDSDELPDYLPVFLEFLSLLPRKDARRHLRPIADVLRTLQSRLDEAHTPYATVLTALNRLIPRGAVGDRPEPPRPMEALMERKGRDAAGAEPLLTPESMRNGSGG
jgi:nitrate reductase delta subunit